MADANGAQFDTIQELQRVRAQLVDMATSLRKQQDILRLRDITFSPGVLGALSTVDEELILLESSLQEEDTETSQLRALAQTSALINSSLDVDTVLAQAMDQIVNLIRAERGFILLKNEQTDQLEFRIARGLDQNDVDSDEVSRTILRDVFATGLPILTDNASADVRLQQIETVARFALRSIMCVPLIYRGHVNGAIYVDNRYREGVFTDRELNLLTAFANQASIAIDNALLFTQVQVTLREITRVKELMENVFASIASGVITTSAEDYVTTFNNAASHILAVPPEQVVGNRLHDVLPKIREDFEMLLRTTREGNQSLGIEAQPDVPERGRIVLSVKLSPLKNAEQETQGVAMVLDDLTQQREREEMLELMTRYLPPGMVDNIHTIADLAMGGERREVTCVFMYACQYSAFPPDLRPPQMMEVLNVYLEVATASIHRARGVIDKYMGNEIMILFNTQLNPEPLHALRAVEMALDMRDAYKALYFRLGITPDPHLYCFGIHTGVATLGNVGSLNRRSFTAIGDAINLTKRIQENSHAGQIVISEDTLRHIEETAGTVPGIRFEERDPLHARGRQQLTRIYEVFHAR
jgi:class 3 adenylate cyclase